MREMSLGSNKQALNQGKAKSRFTKLKDEEELDKQAPEAAKSDQSGEINSDDMQEAASESSRASAYFFGALNDVRVNQSVVVGGLRAASVSRDGGRATFSEYNGNARLNTGNSQCGLSETDQEDFYDDRGHKLIVRMSKLIFMKNEEEAKTCSVCMDEVDQLLGYFFCPTCKVEYCRACAANRDHHESSMAENPFLVATPVS